MRPHYPFTVITFLILLIAAPVCATDFACNNVETCPPMVDPCNCQNAAPLTLSGSDKVFVGAVYSASGGRGPYSYSINVGEINADSGEVLSITSDSETISAADQCENQAQKNVEICKIREWVKIQSEFPTSNIPSVYFTQTITDSHTKTVNYFTRSGVEISPQYSYSSICSDKPENSVSSGDGFVCGTAICGNTPSHPNIYNLPGTIKLHSTVYSACLLQNWGGASVKFYGWPLYDHQYTDIWTLACQQ